jgi:hypothetical protein
MKNILNKILPADKARHIAWGTAFYTALLIFLSPQWALFYTILLALLIELYDVLTEKGNGEILDGIATVILPLILTFLI